MRPPADPRSDLALEVLRDALAGYLRWLQQAWLGDEGPAPLTMTSDADRIVAAVGHHVDPPDADRRRVAATIAALEEAHEGSLAGLSQRLGLSLGDEMLAAAAFWSDADPQFAVVLGCAHDDGARRYPTAALLRLVLAPFGLAVPPAIEAHHRLVRYGVVRPGAGATEPIVLTATARLWLAGCDPGGTDQAATPPLPARLGPCARALSRRLAAPAGGERSITVLRGPLGAGRHALVTEAASAAGLVAFTGARPPAELRLLGRLGHHVIVADEVRAEEVLADWDELDGPVVVVAPPTFRPPAAIAGDALVVDVAAPTGEERRRHWAAVLPDLGLPDRDDQLADQLAGRFRFTEGAIDAAAAHARRQAAWSGAEVDDEALWEACRRQPEHDLERLAALITPTFHLDDLVVSADTRAQLNELLAHVALQGLVLDSWGFRHRMPRGQGVAALFAGPPGTGKTMAAEALAHALHHDLYRVDLSSVVSKWIGETEKNLASAFDEAERSGAVLFFDEADSLFATRTEVRDAHDRYANLEVNYLLQRVEAFTGLVVLASNRRSALDEAFLRRLRFIIHFEMPDREARRELWSRSFPPAAARVELDWDALAAGELAGASIQSVALSAAFLAAADGGTVTLDHLTIALGREYDKLGKSFPGLPVSAGAPR